MKTQHLRRNIILNILLSLILIAVSAYILWFVENDKEITNKEINKIRNESSLIRGQARELETQTKDAKKYKEIWKTIDENKKSTRGIKMDEVNTLITKLADKYSIFTPEIKVLLPENLETGIFKRKTINVSHSSGNLSFQALSDVKAISFISEFVNNLPGYIIISDVEIDKSHEYSDADFINISLGGNPSIVKVKISFAWYVTRDKVQDINKF